MVCEAASRAFFFCCPSSGHSNLHNTLPTSGKSNAVSFLVYLGTWYDALNIILYYSSRWRIPIMTGFHERRRRESLYR
ncbi:hypothetical protein P280DRAFT_192693 [Massarina eburnea CBS 473.64]|uniref:Uncharacterized protein n=1 Tax=Massarina eburnea CBS 473.64 TaxID=1395130 RepID=A0A6A6RMT2_9PLEO|nr:hypothetical protein P280DRAFT_192693 [Massarina eburnea CBS 473.64]